MTVALAVKPRGPYSLAVSARLSSDATRTFRDGVFTALVDVDGRAELTRAWQWTHCSVLVSVVWLLGKMLCTKSP